MYVVNHPGKLNSTLLQAAFEDTTQLKKKLVSRFEQLKIREPAVKSEIVSKIIFALIATYLNPKEFLHVDTVVATHSGKPVECFLEFSMESKTSVELVQMISKVCDLIVFNGENHCIGNKPSALIHIHSY